MIEYKLNKNIFESKTDALVNPVNCQGIMGRGLAKEFKKRYPFMFLDYKNKCENNLVKIGKLERFATLDKTIINFPTKINWTMKSNLEWIELGLIYFVNNYKKWNIKSAAFPQLGCGMGGLEWDSVKSLMEKFLAPLDIRIEIYVNLK